MNLTACPAEGELLRLGLGERSAADFEAFEIHLDSCSDCRRVLAAAASDETMPAGENVGLLQPGTTIGRYVVEGLLGVGGMGIVYTVRDTTLGRKVALKLLRAKDDGLSNQRLAREAKTMAALSNPHVVSVFELGEWQHQVFLVMELVDGMALGQWLRVLERSTSEILRVLRQAGQGLAAAHRAGIVHRDFKPANILVGHDGRVRVTDFGLSRAQATEAVANGSVLDAQPKTLPQSLEPTKPDSALFGTPAYMSPEQLAGERVDARSDQFSFCVTLVEALTGQRPFLADSVAALRATMREPPNLTTVPIHLKASLAKGLSPAPGERFESMEALFAAQLLSSHQAESALSTAPQRRTFFALALMLLWGLVGFAIWLMSSKAFHEPTIEVMVAAVEMSRSTTLTRNMVTLEKRPVKFVTTSVVKPEHYSYIDGQLTLVPIQAGDLILWTQFARAVATPEAP
jgi:eukaryotic-like serine/threonine-protein kinase